VQKEEREEDAQGQRRISNDENACSATA